MKRVVVYKREFVVSVPYVRNIVCRRRIIRSMLLTFRQCCICALWEEGVIQYIYSMYEKRVFAC